MKQKQKIHQYISQSLGDISLNKLKDYGEIIGLLLFAGVMITTLYLLNADTIMITFLTLIFCISAILYFIFKPGKSSKSDTDDKKQHSEDHPESQQHIDITRLRTEMDDIRQQSMLNLILGFSMVLLGAGILAYPFVDDLEQLQSNATYEEALSQLIVNIAPRVGLGLILQIFAFFFLRIYKDTRADIKSYHYEITYLEALNFAVECHQNAIDCLHEDEVDKRMETIKLKADIAMALDRIPLLDHGQSTAELERVRMDHSYDKELIKSLLEVHKTHTRLKDE